MNQLTRTNVSDDLGGYASLMQSILVFLGLSRPVLQPGFQPNERAGSMPVCQVCGASVAFESQQLHKDWHATLPV